MDQIIHRRSLRSVFADAPLTALDPIPAVMITHDVDEAIFLSDRVIMMTSGPRAQIGDVLNIHLERPRERKAVLEHSDFYDYRGHLISFLEG